MVHPFYQRHKGWNGIRFQLYSSLGRNSQNMGDINLAVQFFRNLLQLCCEFDHQQEQKNCLNEFLIAVQNWSTQKSINLIGVDSQEQNSEQKAHIGQLNLPIILEDSIEVFISGEKLHTNRPDTMINSHYISYPDTSANILDDNQEYVIQQKAELNSANCPWKFLAKHIFEHMNEEKRKNPEYEICNDACQFNGEEINEFAIYDCSSRARKRDLTIKKVRKAYVNESIIVKLLMKNPLMADIFINNIKLVCRYEDQENSKDDFEQLERSIILRSLETKEILLEIFPKKTGRFIIERIEWILFDVVSCAYQMVRPIDKDAKILTQEELVVPKKLLEREMNFTYDIIPLSGEVQARITVGEQNEISFIFTEYQQSQLIIQNLSPMKLKNGYIVCSHPMIFGFTRMRLFDSISPNGKLILPLVMRASLMQQNEIKFLLRYEVDNQPKDEGAPQIDKMSRFRFTRIVYNMDSQYAFQPKRHVHLSTKKANEHIFNIQIVDNIAPGAFYQTPQIQAIEIINRKKLWTLKKKDEKGQFFIIIPNKELEEVSSIIKYRNEAQVQSIFEVEQLKNFFEQELNFVMNKFKMAPTQEEEEVDIILQWAMPQLNKKGFYCLFKIPLLKVQKQLTEQQNKLQRQNSMKIKDGSVIPSARDLPKINPLHIAYSYQKQVDHDFGSEIDGTPLKPLLVTFSLSISNMIQINEFTINCKVEAQNEWSSLINPADVSEGESFLWVGKTQHIIRNLKTNEIKRVDLKCAILKPGVYNLNRFRIVIKEDENQARHHFVNEIKLPDDILITVRNIDQSKNGSNTAFSAKKGELISFD